MLCGSSAAMPGGRRSATAVGFGTLERRRMQRAHLANAWMRRQQVDSDALRRAGAEYCEAFIPSDPAWRAVRKLRYHWKGLRVGTKKIPA